MSNRKLTTDFQRVGLARQMCEMQWLRSIGVTNTGAISAASTYFYLGQTVPQLSNTVIPFRPRGGTMGQLRFGLIDDSATVNGRAFSWALWSLAQTRALEQVANAADVQYEYSGQQLLVGTGTIGSASIANANCSMFSDIGAKEVVGLCDTLTVTSDYTSIPGAQILNGGVVGAFWCTLQFTQPICTYYLLELRAAAGRPVAQFCDA